MPLPDSAIDIPDRADYALMKKILTKEWGIMPWEYHKLTVKDLQDIGLAEHAESYIEVEQQNRARNGSSLSKSEYNVGKSRQNAFQ